MLKRHFFYLFTVVTACDLLLKKSSSVMYRLEKE